MPSSDVSQIPPNPENQARTNPTSWQEERVQLEHELQERITLDALTGAKGSESKSFTDDAGTAAGWLIAQRKKGHRHSADDVLTAWYALQISPPVSEHLDLGTGIGTVGLLTLWGMGHSAQLTCVEAQEISYRLLLTNLRANGLNERVHPMLGDLRELALPKKFSLITGSPPYFPEGAGVIPLDSQKAHARFELRGDVRDYATTAASHLTPGGWFVFCFPSPQKQRALDAITAAGLCTVRMRDVIPRESLGALFSLFACQHQAEVHRETIIEQPLIVRLLCGRLSSEMAAVRRGFGFIDGDAHGGYQQKK